MPMLPKQRDILMTDEADFNLQRFSSLGRPAGLVMGRIASLNRLL